MWSGSYRRVLSLVQNMQTLGQLFEPLYNMMQPHGGGRMEEKHEHEGCTCVWQHSHAQHGNELLRIKLGLMKQGLP